MKYNPTLSEIMSIDPVRLRPNDKMDLLDTLFRQHNFHHLPVVDDQNKVIGMISKSDYLMLCNHKTLFLKERERANNLHFFRTLLVEEVMAKPVATLRADQRLSMAVGYFRENIFHAIPIVNKDGQLAGIVTTLDLINYAYNEFNLLSLDQSNLEQPNRYP